MILQRFIKKPPVLFPLVALFHIAMLAYSIYNYSDEPFPSKGWLQPLWMLCYTISWIFCCDMKRWAGLAYIGLTSLNLGLLYFAKSHHALQYYTGPFFPMDVVFTFFVMFYFRQMD